MPQPTARDRFLALLRDALTEGTLNKLTLGKYRGPDATLRNVFIRPVALKTGPHLAFLWRHATRDVTKNLTPDAGLDAIVELLGRDFLDAHLFTTTQSAQFESDAERLKITASTASAAPLRPTAAGNDRPKAHLIPASAPWLKALGVINDRGQPREGMADKFRQIQKFAELLTHLLDEAFPDAATPLKVSDMGSGKGYLTFALAEVLGARAHVRGIELRPELVELCNRIAQENGLAERLAFTPGTIAASPLSPGECDVLIALHACDTATDDALAAGIAAGAQLLVVAPCCQKELRRQLTAPPVLAPALRHGIFQERQAEFVTDALRAQLLECAGYRTKVFEFISTEHTAKNLMIAAIKTPAADPAAVDRARAFAAFYGIRQQKLAEHLRLPLTA
ncbi:MAG TPA: SAM-dependent methyltransferase [Opitutaceae bacterium]